MPVNEGFEDDAEPAFSQPRAHADDPEPRDPSGQTTTLKVAELEERLAELENRFKLIATSPETRPLSSSVAAEHATREKAKQQLNSSKSEDGKRSVQASTSLNVVSHPELVPAVKVFRQEEEFFNQEDHPLHVIEVLHPNTMSQRTSKLKSRVVNGTTTSNTPRPLPARIRFRSRWLLNELAVWTGQDLLKQNQSGKQDNPAVSLVFLYPFKLFIRYEEQIRGFLDLGRNQLQGLQTNQHDGQATARSAIRENQLKQLDALESLINLHMEPVFTLRRELRTQVRTDIVFEHLWLLFDSGDIVYERERKLPLFLPELWAVIYYEGGREILNNNRPRNPAHGDQMNSKGQQSVFSVVYFGLARRGSKVTKVRRIRTIPRWEGERSINSLKMFPYKFCRPKTDFPGDVWDVWRKTLADRGRTFCSCEPGSVVYVEGKGMDENQNLWEYQSEAIIDVDLARLEAPKLFHPRYISKHVDETKPEPHKKDDSISIRQGDEREILEIPSRVSATFGDVVIFDTIHDDVTMEFAYFTDKGHNLAGVVDEINAGKELNLEKFDDFFCLCPSTIPGFILTARKWVMLGLDSLAEDEDRLQKQGMLWRELRLPQTYKTAISATVLRYQSREQVLYQGRLSGRGTGSIILLQGPPGVGKTFAAEALADHINKPLYSVTSGELGQTPAEVERELVQIFTRCQKWKCVALIDEADIFIGIRAASFQRNAILSVFLRQLERYSGILVMTTNRFCDIDPAIIQRVHLRLALPAFNRLVTGEVWDLYCDPERVKDLIAETGLERPKVAIEEGVTKWWLVHYNKAQSSSVGLDEQTGEMIGEQRSRSWWSGRDIQYAFRAAAALAVLESSEKRRTRLEADKRTLDQTIRSLEARHRNCESQKKRLEEVGKELAKDMIITEEDEVCLTKRHFDEILKRNETFLTTAEHMQVLSPNGYEIDRVPDEGLQYE